MTVTLETVKRLRDAQYAYCPTCTIVFPITYWGPSKSKWMHENGTGHRVQYVRVVGP